MMRKAAFISPMLLRPTERLREGSAWRYELKHDGHRAIAFKSRGKLYLRSRNDKDFADRYPEILKGLTKLPDETDIDGEVVAFDEDGRPSFNTLQNSASSDLKVAFYVYDLMVLEGKDLMAEPFGTRRATPEEKVLPKLKEPVRY
jgi:bifunctional non-homologous end joining protein LigD